MKTKKILGIFLALAISSGNLSACSQLDATTINSAISLLNSLKTGTDKTSTTSNTTSTNANTNTSTNTNVTTAKNTNSSTTAKTNQVTIKKPNTVIVSAEEAKDALASLSEDEILFSESEELFEDSFATKAVRDDQIFLDEQELRDEIERNFRNVNQDEMDTYTSTNSIANFSRKIEAYQPKRIQVITPNTKTPNNTNNNKAVQVNTSNNATKTTTTTTTKVIERETVTKTTKFVTPQTYQDNLKRNGAIVIEPDGTIIINPVRVQELIIDKEAELRKQIEKQKQELQKKIKALETELNKIKKQVENYKLIKLKDKNITVTRSNMIIVENDDGTITKTVSFEFKNQKTGTTKINRISKTYENNKVIKIEHYLTVKIDNYLKTTTRINDIYSDGSQKIITESKTVWKNGKTRELNEEINISVSGNRSSSGTIIVKLPNGKTFTYNLSTSVTQDGLVENTVSDAIENTTVTVEEQDDGTVIATVNEDGTESTEIINPVEASEVSEENTTVTEELIENTDTSTDDTTGTTTTDNDATSEDTSNTTEDVVESTDTSTDDTTGTTTTDNNTPSLEDDDPSVTVNM